MNNLRKFHTKCIHSLVGSDPYYWQKFNELLASKIHELSDIFLTPFRYLQNIVY